MTIPAEPPAAVSPAASAFGFAGLLPQAAVAAAALIAPHAALPFAALIYGGVILSLLGGIWWGFAMRRAGGQAGLAALSVVPSLIAAALLAASARADAGWLCVALGSAIMLTLPVDRWLASSGDAPAGWMRLRVPLSLGLGGLTILVGALAG